MPPICFRRFNSGSLPLAFVIHTCRAQDATFPTTLTTTALNRSSSGWFAASACTATAKGHQTTRSGSSISRTAPHPAAWSPTSSLLQRSCSHPSGHSTRPAPARWRRCLPPKEQSGARALRSLKHSFAALGTLPLYAYSGHAHAVAALLADCPASNFSAYLLVESRGSTRALTQTASRARRAKALLAG